MPGGRKPGYRHTEETKRRISAAQRAYRARVRKAMKALAALEAERDTEASP